MGPTADALAELMRTAAGRRVQLVELRDRARREAEEARREAARIRGLALEAIERAEAIVRETEVRLARARARR
jgi:hypothetical protein